ncbi:MAG: arsenate reductase ArsC [Trueperaceae bacterium]
MRVLVLCTHNSARSQMAEGWIRKYANAANLPIEVWSAGTEATEVKPDAIMVMAEVGVDLAGHASKTLYDVPDPWTFDLVLTVCDAANEACPTYPARTERRHVAFPDPSGEAPDRWREVRDAIGAMSHVLVQSLAQSRFPSEAELGSVSQP